MLQVNDIVKFHSPNIDECPDQVYALIEINDNRCIIQALNTGLSFPPTNVVLLSDLIKA